MKSLPRIILLNFGLGYFIQNSKSHSNFTIGESGLVINPKWSYISASPDRIVGCSCCGKRCLEIKCPYSDKDNHITYIAGQKNSYLYYQEDGTVFLKSNHPYFYQVQTQMLVTGFQFCDFFVWTNCDSLQIVIENDEYIQAEIINKAKNLFCKVLLPELTTKYFTKPNKKNDTNLNDTWCMCKMDGTEDDLIMCEDNSCKIIWFHFKCMRIKKIPKGKWFCPECRKKRKIIQKESVCDISVV